MIAALRLRAHAALHHARDLMGDILDVPGLRAEVTRLAGCCHELQVELRDAADRHNDLEHKLLATEASFGREVLQRRMIADACASAQAWGIGLRAKLETEQVARLEAENRAKDRAAEVEQLRAEAEAKVSTNKQRVWARDWAETFRAVAAGDPHTSLDGVGAEQWAGIAELLELVARRP